MVVVFGVAGVSWELKGVHRGGADHVSDSRGRGGFVRGLRLYDWKTGNVFDVSSNAMGLVLM